MHLTKIEFSSLLSYSPRGNSVSEKQSKTVMTYLKNDEFILNRVLMSEYISELIKENITSLPFSSFITNSPILVPIPKSSLTKPGTLWVPQRLAKALVHNGLGKTVKECLKRIEALPKSATSLAKDRPKAVQHYHSIEIQKIFPEPEEILVIDDIVTRGATIVGAANKLYDAFPRAHIQAFAAMRTISPPQIFKAVYEPCKGEITLSGQDTFRRP
jgi:predicted amidophosphoribosyltransferase